MQSRRNLYRLLTSHTPPPALWAYATGAMRVSSIHELPRAGVLGNPELESM
jgi:hypothetical protein